MGKLTKLIETINQNPDIKISKSFSGLPHYRFSRDFLNFLFCRDYELLPTTFESDYYKRIELSTTAHINFKYNKNKIKCTSHSGVFGVSSSNYKKNTSLIKFSGELPCFEDENYLVVQIDNTDNNLELIIFQPKSTDAVYQIFDSVQTLLLKPLNLRKIEFLLPKVINEVVTNLNSFYTNSGFNSGFSEQSANFSNINNAGYLYLDSVINKYSIKIDISGIDISSTDKVQFYAQENEPEYLWVLFWMDLSYNGKFIPSDFYDFFFETVKIDCYPFIYIVKDKRSGKMLFSGFISNP